MAKRRYEMDEQKIARFLKEGRGQGHGVHYKPWLTIQDLSSKGRSSRPKGARTGREHHLLSDLEIAAFHMYNWCSEEIQDIREQFPLDREETRRIAKEMGVPHPKDPKTKIDIVMTSDFVLDVNPSGSVIVRSVKYEKDLQNNRNLEKLEIERRLWRNRPNCLDWAMVTENELPKQRTMTLAWLHEMYSLEGLVEPQQAHWATCCSQFLSELHDFRNSTFSTFEKHLASMYGFWPGDAITVLRHLAATKQIPYDVDLKFRTTTPLSKLIPNLDQYLQTSWKKVS